MGTTAYEAISEMAETIRSRIWTARLSLGELYQVLDRDEDPAILAQNSTMLPTVCVIPLGEGKDTVMFSMGSDDWRHDLTVFIVGYYRFSQDRKTPYDNVDTMRQYAYALLELFRGNNAHFGRAHVYSATVEIHPYLVADVVLDRFLISMKVKLMES